MLNIIDGKHSESQANDRTIGYFYCTMKRTNSLRFIVKGIFFIMIHFQLSCGCQMNYTNHAATVEDHLLQLSQGFTNVKYFLANVKIMLLKQ